METKEIMIKYWSHVEAIKRVGGFPLSKELQLSDLGEVKEMKAITQKCYNEIKKDGLDISVIDYLCRISTQFIVANIKADTQIDYAMKIVNGYFENEAETKNLLRYFMKDPFFLLMKIKTNEPDHLKTFYILGGLWFTLKELEFLESIYSGSPELEAKMIKQFWKTKANIFSTNQTK